MTIAQKHSSQGGRNSRAASIAAMVGVLLVGGLGACGSTSNQVAQQPPPQSTTPIPAAVELTVIAPSDGAVVVQPGLAMHGTATRGSRVFVNGQRVTVNGRDWRTSLSLTAGTNTIALSATKEGFAPVASSITITRKLSPAEKAQQEATFKASATSIPYAELLKDSSPFVGNHVVFTGQILQIQQSGGNGGTMLLSVTDQGNGIWTDNVWVDYDNSTPAVANDVITVYGTVSGTKSYDTQSGGSTFVPQMHARYIDQSGTPAPAPTPPPQTTTAAPQPSPPPQTSTTPPQTTGYPGTVTGTDNAGHNIGINCSDNPASPLGGCNDGNGRGPANNLSYGSVTGTNARGYMTGIVCSDDPKDMMPACLNGPDTTGSAGGGSFCSTHSCIPNFDNGTGYIVQCGDGQWSQSGGLAGACSDHQGETTTTYP